MSDENNNQPVISNLRIIALGQVILTQNVYSDNFRSSVITNIVL